jgi:hypothetical protein
LVTEGLGSKDESVIVGVLILMGLGAFFRFDKDDVFDGEE